MRTGKLFIILFLVVSSFIYAEKLPVGKEYELELSDPYHRHVHLLSPYYTFYENNWESYGSFWEFLEKEQELLQEMSPALYHPSYRMVWLEDEGSRSAYAAVFIQDDAGGITMTTQVDGILSDGKWMFVQIDDTFFVGMEKKFQFHHTSLSAGQPVDSAGTFSIKDGALRRISLVSGHYRPKVVHGHQCLQALEGKELDLSGLQMTYCVIDEGMVFKKRVTVDEFLDSASDEHDGTAIRFFLPMDAAMEFDMEKAELFLTGSGELWIGNSKLEANDPLCQEMGPYDLVSSIKLHDGKITHVIFNTQLDVSEDIDRMKRFILSLIDYGIDVDDIRFRIIRDHEKETVSWRDIYQLRSNPPRT